MAKMTLEEKRQRRAKNKAIDERLAKSREEAKRVVATGKCPTCGRKLRRNLAMAGWFQCEQFGSELFRTDKNLPHCGFQCFTE